MAFLQEYTMLDELGKGGFATVYKVRHNELGYIRAIRVLNETIVDQMSKTYQKFLRECMVLLRLGNGNHPNIVHIYQPRLLDNKALVEMDYVDGEDILHYLKQNQNFVPTEEVIKLATQISSALAYCHEDIYRFCMDRGMDNLQDDPNDGSKVLIDDHTRKKLIDKYKVIHNDIHSGNIMRREDGNFVLLDFGLAINGDEVVRSSRHTNGAPEFKAPEKWDDDSILTEQTDIYSFGIVLFQYLAGQVPFPYNTNLSAHKAEFELGESHQKVAPPSIEDIRREKYEKKFVGQQYERDYPQWLEDVIIKCLQKNPAKRFRNGKELYEYIIAQSQMNNSICNDVEIEKLTQENKKLGGQIIDLRNNNTLLNVQLTSTELTLQQTHDALSRALNKVKDLEKDVSKKKRLSLILIVLVILLGLWAFNVTIMYTGGSAQTNYALQTADTLQMGDNTVYAPTDVLISELKEQVKSLESQVSKKDKEINTLKHQITDGAKSPDTSNSKELAILKTEIAKLKKQLEQKVIDLENANKEIAALKKALN